MSSQSISVKRDYKQLEGFITIVNNRITFDTSCLEKINESHPKYKYIITYIIKCLRYLHKNRDDDIYADIEDIYDSYLTAIVKKYPNNYDEPALLCTPYISSYGCYNYNEYRPIEIHLDIYNVLFSFQEQTPRSHDMVALYMEQQLAMINNPLLVNSIIKSFIYYTIYNICYSIDELLKAICAGIGIINLNEKYYKVLFEVYTLKDFKHHGIMHCDKKTIKTIEAGIKNGIIMDWKSIEYIKNSYCDYNELIYVKDSDLTFDYKDDGSLSINRISGDKSIKIHNNKVYSMLVNCLLVIDNFPNIPSDVVNEFISVVDDYKDKSIATYWRDSLTNNTLDIFISKVIKYCRQQHYNEISSYKIHKSYRTTDRIITETMLANPNNTKLIYKKKDISDLAIKHSKYMAFIYNSIRTSFSLYIPTIEYNTYLYKELHPFNIINYHEWRYYEQTTKKNN